MADTARVERAVATGDAVLLDARSPKMFTGQAGPWLRQGRFPGAVNRFFKADLTESRVWLPREQLAAAYAAIGVDGSKPVITYCGRGEASSQAYFTLRYVLGMPDVSNYNASFGEWSDGDIRPVDAGSAGPGGPARP